MIKKQIRYNFNYIDKCNMCGSDARSHKILGKRLNQSQGRNPTNKIGITTTVAMCTECKLIYSNPQPVPVDIQDHYGVPPEEYWNDDYFKIEQNYFKHEIDTLKGLIEFREGMKSLDVGAGLGKAMIALAKTGFDSYGFEPSEPFYKRAVSKMGISEDKLRLGMLEDVEYPENNFDFISFGAVLEHLYDPSGSIIKALKWLRPNGIVHIEVPSTDWLINDIINLYYKVTGQNYVGNLSPMHEPYHLYEFSLRSFEAHAKQNGYDIAFSEYHVCQTYMPKISDLILKPYMKWSNKGMQLCVWLRKK
jgi:2-polyprenyl-3-methyl-5-hydroxy-6-metoxy-1,4-benzoquinol methylase